MDDQPTSVTKRLAPQAAPTAPAVRRRRRWRLLGWLGAAVVAVALLLVWWRAGNQPRVSYTTQPLGRGAVVRTVTATGTVNPVLTIIIGSYVSGVIQSLSCDYNTVVSKGQVCAKIDPRPYQAVLDQYSGQLQRDQGILAKDRMDLARYQKLAAQDSISRQQAEDQVYVVQQDEGTVQQDQGLVEGARQNLAYTDITSPVDGVVVSRNVTQGQTVAASFQTPTLFLIATDLKTMQVDTNTSESDIGVMKEGNKASFTVDAYADRVFQGSVTQIRRSPQTVQNVVTYDAVVGVDNSDLALMPGMTATTQITVAERPDVLRIPDQAVRYAASATTAARAAANQPQVFVLRHGAPVAVAVTLGLDDGSFSELLKGDLQPGNAVITAEQSAPSAGVAALRLPRF